MENWYYGEGASFITSHLHLREARWPTHRYWPPDVLACKLWNRILPPSIPRWSHPVNQPYLQVQSRTQTVPDLLHAFADQKVSLDILEALLHGLPDSVPVLLEIHDFFPDAHQGYYRTLRRLKPRLAEVWTATQAIADQLSAHAGIQARVVTPIAAEIPSPAKTRHAPFSRDFQAVVMGNFWNIGVIHSLKKIWSLCQNQEPGLPSIRWHCHPDGIAYVRNAGLIPEPELIPAPFLRGDALWTMLRDADLAFIPFSMGSLPTTDYERYSIPSRLAELCAIGMPFIAFAADPTPLRDFLDQHKCGLCTTADDPAVAAQQCLNLMHNLGHREQLGARARSVAETHLNIIPKRELIFARWRQLAASSPGTSP
jgi:hypothetical protein